jgi:hypothetical protein
LAWTKMSRDATAVGSWPLPAGVAIQAGTNRRAPERQRLGRRVSGRRTSSVSRRPQDVRLFSTIALAMAACRRTPLLREHVVFDGMMTAPSAERDAGGGVAGWLARSGRRRARRFVNWPVHLGGGRHLGGGAIVLRRKSYWLRKSLQPSGDGEDRGRQGFIDARFRIARVSRRAEGSAVVIGNR